uniref:diphosphoinositol-polyphosphate diphosphatase n=1 Tax=Oryzias melastigma TaxID=30732 RepID=A0A3B3BZG1_ORYME
MMKLKSNQTRTYDGDGYKKRAACLCFRSEAEEEVLLVSSSRHPDKWIVPGGGMEPEEEPNVAAAREVCEEAGVKGTLGRLVGIFEVSHRHCLVFVNIFETLPHSGILFLSQNRERKHRTYVYVLIVTEVLEDWEDSVNIGKTVGYFLPKLENSGPSLLQFAFHELFSVEVWCMSRLPVVNLLLAVSPVKNAFSLPNYRNL